MVNPPVIKWVTALPDSAVIAEEDGVHYYVVQGVNEFMHYIVDRGVLRSITIQHPNVSTGTELPGYYTSEVLTERRWKGKPIYRKVYTIEMTGNQIPVGEITMDTITDIDEPVGNWSFQEYGESYYMYDTNTMQHGGGGVPIEYVFITSAKDVVFSISGWSNSFSKINYVLEYTKITDTTASPVAATPVGYNLTDIWCYTGRCRRGMPEQIIEMHISTIPNATLQSYPIPDFDVTKTYYVDTANSYIRNPNTLDTITIGTASGGDWLAAWVTGDDVVLSTSAAYPGYEGYITLISIG